MVKSQKPKKVVVLLPTYNESGNIERFTKEVLDEEKNAPEWRFEVLIVDSNSPDGTFEIAKKMSQRNPKIHVISVGPGLGTGLIEGHKFSVKHFNPDALAQLDADGQVKADVLPRLLKALDEGYTLAVGSRFIPGGKNLLSPSRRFFSAGSSYFCRLVIGPTDLKEWSNSARAFTPQLFSKINLSLVPWKEKTFIVQPAFLNAAVMAGAKFKEVPLVFKNRAEGYSKMKIFNYTYDVITYSLEMRLKKWGINIPLFYLTRRAKTVVKFGMVGFAGTLVDFIFYNLFIGGFGVRPATAKGFSTSIAIFNNFMLNNYWTFRHRKTKTNFWQKLGIFYIVSFGGLAIAVFIVKILHTLYGDGVANILGIKIAYYNLYFFATIPPVMTWNFLVNHFITWRNKGD